jgi:hypothetical protein
MGEDNQMDEHPQDLIVQLENQDFVRVNEHGKQPKAFSRRRVRVRPPEKEQKPFGGGIIL